LPPRPVIRRLSIGAMEARQVAREGDRKAAG
jgi:hypothetical protein